MTRAQPGSGSPASCYGVGKTGDDCNAREDLKVPATGHQPPAGGHQPPAAATSHQRRAGEGGVPARLQWREDLGGPGGEEVDQDPARVGVASQLLLCGEDRGRLQRQGGPESSLATSCKPEMEELLHASTGHQPPASSWGDGGGRTRLGASRSAPA